jgi:hypothetical protein
MYTARILRITITTISSIRVKPLESEAMNFFRQVVLRLKCMTKNPNGNSMFGL